MEERWSNTVEDYYPVTPRSRWGSDNPVHAGFHAALERGRSVYESNLSNLNRFREALYAVPVAQVEHGPFWDNIWFSCLDAAVLVTILLSRRSRRYIEIGSGHSTQFARHAVDWGSLDTLITSIDPQPRASIDTLCHKVIRSRLEDCSLEMFDELEAGDILFFDGSHRIFTNSDTTVLFLEVLPRLKPGVLVHLHDIFLPADYPDAWNRRLYSEQYLLGAMLLCKEPPLKPLLPSFFICTDPNLSTKVRQVFDDRPGAPIPFYYNNDATTPGVSFWFEKM